MFSNFFGSNKKSFKSTIKVDLHSHLIPGIDDGVKTIEESLSILRKFENLGFKKVITTPHIMGDFYKNTPEIIRSGLMEVQEAADKENLNLEIEAAAEYYLDEYFIKILKKNEEILTLTGNYLLFELPYINQPIHMEEAIFMMQSQGYKPVLAHPERYQFYQGQLDKLVALREKGVHMQLNLNSIIGYYSRPVEKMAKNMIKKNMVDFVGSDVHNLKHAELLEKSLGSKHIRKLNSSYLKNNSLL
ncbi:MAG: CpsB/CapC family capsule biosynthesis tyrosine phosphatase [Cytophagales bacterium]